MKFKLFVALFGTAFAASSHAATFTWTNTAGGSFTTPTNWDTPPTFGPDNLLDFSTLNITAATAVTLDAATTVGGLKFQDATTASHDWTVNGTTAAPATLALTLQTTSGTPEINVANRTASLNPILAGAQGFNKTGAGTLALLNLSNTFTGPVAVTAGTLQLGNIANTGTFAFLGSSLSVNGSTLNFGGSSASTYTHTYNFANLTGPISLSGSTLSFNSTNATTKNFNAALAFTGSNTIAYTGTNYGHNLNLNQPLGGTGTLTFNYTNNASASARTVNLAAGLTNTFAGAVVLNSASTSNGGVTNFNMGSAIGATSFEVRNGWSLNNNAPAGALDTATTITLANTASNANLGTGWTNAAGILTLTDGNIRLGSGGQSYGTVSIASLTQTAGNLNLDLGATSASSDKVILSGDYTYTSGGINITLQSDPGANVYELVSYGGIKTGNPAVTLTNASRFTPVVDYGTGSNSKITVSFTGSGAGLIWKGNDPTSPNVWDVNTTANWDNAGVADKFFSLDSVTFNDTAASFAPTLAVSVSPLTTTFSNSANAYTLTGAGAIAGTGPLVKNGTGNATVSTANSFTGDVTVNAGKLTLGNIAALGGAGSKNVIVNSGGQLDFAGLAPGATRTYTFKIAGTGDGNGALHNSSATEITSNAGILNLELTADASVGGVSRFDVGRTGSTSGLITGNGHTLTKIGANGMSFRGDATATPINIVVNTGRIWAEDVNTGFGGATGSVTVNTGAKLGTYNVRTIATPVTLNAGATLYNEGAGLGTWTGAFTLGGNATMEANGQPVTVSGIIGETGGARSLTKTGNNTLTLAGNNTYTGTTTVAAGVLQVGPSDNNTVNVKLGSGVTVQNAATLDFARLHALTTQTTTYNIGTGIPITLETGATLRFRGSTGTTIHNLANPIITAGTTTINNNGGGYGNRIALGGKISGTGTINYQSTSDSGSADNDVRSLTVNNATTDFSGNWFVDYTVTTANDTVALIAGAAGSLGTGGVSLDDRATLTQTISNGLGSLGGVTLLKATSLLNTGNFAWTNPAASLTVTDGTVRLGSAEVSIGNLSGTAGTIQGNAATASLTVNQTVDGTFAGIIGQTTGNTLAFTKTGSAKLTLSGANSYTGNTTVSGGILSLGSAALADQADVRLTSGGVLDLPHGATDSVDEFYIDGVQQAYGTWGGLGSSASHKTGRITGTGLLQVNTGAGGNAYDNWATTSNLTGADNAKNLDPDNDGRNNLAEFAFDGVPLSGTNDRKIVSKTVAGVTTLTLPVRKGAAFTTDVNGLKSGATDSVYYRIQASTDLATWTLPVTEVTPALTSGMPGLSDTAGWEYRTFQVAAGNAKAFIRVKVSDTP